MSPPSRASGRSMKASPGRIRTAPQELPGVKVGTLIATEACRPLPGAVTKVAVDALFGARGRVGRGVEVAGDKGVG